MGASRRQARWGAVSLTCALVLTGIAVTSIPPAYSPQKSAAAISRPDSSSVGAALLQQVPHASGPHKFLMTDDFGNPARWDPCRTITWQWRQATTEQFQAANTAFTQVSKGSGLHFAPTTEEPAIRISITPLARGVLGYGSFWAHPLSEENGKSRNLKATEGTLSVSPHATRLDSVTLLNLLMHEIGHIVGLDHVDDRKQIMFKEVQHRTQWGPGDLAGLRQVGRTQGCLPG